MFGDFLFKPDFRFKFFKLYIKAFVILFIFFILLSVYNKESLFGPPEINEKATIEYLINFCNGDITKLIILTEGKYSKFEAVCTFVITDKKIIKEFKNIILKQESTIKKRAVGQLGRRTQITMYNTKNEKYSFSFNGEPYSGNRPINEAELSFFENPTFDVSENYLPRPYNALSDNISSYGPISSNLQNYEIYYFLKKYIIDFTEENRTNTDEISGKCYITYIYK